MRRRQRTCQRKVISKEMHLFKKKKLYSSSGKLVKNPKQAIAIALSVSRKKCHIKDTRKRSRKKYSLKKYSRRH